MHNINADKAAILPAAISFEQAAASFLKGLTVYYLLRKTYEIKPDEQFLFHAAAGGVGLIACQWAKALGAKLIGTVGTAQKAQSALKAGAWQVINYREENLVERLKEITGGKKVRVVYDSVGRDTWERSLDCLQRRGLMVSFGNSARGVRFSGQRHLGTVAGLPATPRLNGEFWQLIRCGYRCELRHSQSDRLVVCDTPFPARLYHHAG